MTLQDFPNTQSDHSVTQENFCVAYFGNYKRTSVSIEISAKRR